MKRSIVLITLVCISFVAFAAAAQNSSASNSDRKIVSRVEPIYPDLAKRMHIHGVVRIEAIVRPNGAVKSTRVLGGNPVLVDAAQTAVGKWKFEPGQTESTEVVQLSFEER